MKRYAFCLALVSFVSGSMILPVSAVAATSAAKKFCSEQWDAEKKAKTVPRGMGKAKYIKQCTANYTANHKSDATPGTSNQSPPLPDH